MRIIAMQWLYVHDMEENPNSVYTIIVINSKLIYKGHYFMQERLNKSTHATASCATAHGSWQPPYWKFETPHTYGFAQQILCSGQRVWPFKLRLATNKQMGGQTNSEQLTYKSSALLQIVSRFKLNIANINKKTNSFCQKLVF